ncbi:DUF6265 family protein [Caulobacter sp. NIBR2454]|uniref:DUF6265 family protein n=1 Tax=Caulobacter sp. NIBR2454 TaxID=3015996 RepID=UPI0022B5F244|nr:DUF6265 family protein [Caulobacter sp. NIBR2454]
MKALTLITLLASAPAVQPVEELSWLVGSWTQKTAERDVVETWEPLASGVMKGVSVTKRPNRPDFVETTTITTEAAGPTFTATIPGQAPTAFVRLPGPPGEAVFENKAHDFPQRVIYRRCDEDLCAAIEGTVKGEPRRSEWRYRRMR